MVMQAIIERAIGDEKFREKMLQTPDAVAFEYKLDSKQAELLRNVDRRNTKKCARVPDKDIVMKLGW